MKLLAAFICAFFFSFVLLAQVTFPVNGVKEKDLIYNAFTQATIVNYKDTLKDATLLIRKGKIEAVGKDVKLPKGTIVHDLKGKYIYPSFVDPFSAYGIPKVEMKKNPRGPQFLSDKKGAFAWNEALKPEINAAEIFAPDEKEAKALRNIGFGAVSSLEKDGIARGTSVLVLLGDDKENDLILKEK